MARVTTRVCALCDKTIPDTWIVCREHYKHYHEYKDDEWFQVLVVAQRRQFEIDNVEHVIIRGGRQYRKYRRLSTSEKIAIKYLHDRGLGAVSIGKALGIAKSTVEKYVESTVKSNK